MLAMTSGSSFFTLRMTSGPIALRTCGGDGCASRFVTLCYIGQLALAQMKFLRVVRQYGFLP